MSQFKKGDAVTQVVPAPIEGTVEGFALDQDTGEVKILVEYSDSEGNTHSGYFSQSDFTAK
jgi:hypothetical protein